MQISSYMPASVSNMHTNQATILDGTTTPKHPDETPPPGPRLQLSPSTSGFVKDSFNTLECEF